MSDSVFDSLTRVLPPPRSPIANGSPEAWAVFESRLGLELPRDYKRFVSTYGSGLIDGFVSVFSPFAEGLSNLGTRILEYQAAHIVAIEYEDEPEGLIPWATNDYRGQCHWETDNPDPNAWTVYAALDDDVHRFPESMTTFLLKVLTGEHISTVFGGPTHRFRPPVRYDPQT